MNIRAIPGLAAAVLGLWLAPAPRAEAAYIATMLEVGADVVVTGSGTINLAAVSFQFSGGTSGGIAPYLGYVVLGPPGDVSVDRYSATFTGPSSFGVGGEVPSDVGTGDRIVIVPRASFFLVPAGYVSGTALSGTATFLNDSFATLGVTPGTYVWTWGEGETLDSFTLNIGPVVEAVPEPASLALLGAGLLGLGVARRRAGR